jgi:ABC-type dipeptide/oligopeptide/nickel transport system ATPase component
MIIGITGKAGCGKSTLAGYISNAFYSDREDRGRSYVEKTSVCVMSFADPIRDVAAAVFGSRYESQESKASIDEWWQARIRSEVTEAQRQYYASDHEWFELLGDAPVTGRRVLQFIGTDMFRERVHPDIWLYAMERRLPSEPDVHVIIPDVRFENEGDWIRSRGGIVYHLWREGQEEAPAAHASEMRLLMKARDVYASASSLQGLRNIARDIIRDHLK